MPIYEYKCRDCGRRFEALVGGSRSAACPSCEGDRLERLLSVFAVGANGEKSDFSAAPGPCNTCGDPRGPGSCAIN